MKSWTASKIVAKLSNENPQFCFLPHQLCLLLHQFLLTSRELDLEWFSSRWRSTRRQIWSKICDIEDERNFEVFWQINMTGVEHAIAELFKAIKEYKDIMEPDESLGCLNLQTKVKNRYPDNLYWSCRMKKVTGNQP